MAFQWSENLAIGVDTIDDQHKWMFARVNNLLSAMDHGKGKEELCEVIAFLADYVTILRDEEEIMVKYNYEGYSSHRAGHRQFAKDVSVLKEEFETYGATSHLAVQTQLRLCNWLMNHIKNEDKRLGMFLKMSAPFLDRFEDKFAPDLKSVGVTTDLGRTMNLLREEMLN